MNIGQLSQASGVPAKAIRYYESIGLLPPAERSGGNYRTYPDRDVHLLKFIKQARDQGYSLQDIKAMLELWQDQSRTHSEVQVLALEHILDLETRIKALQNLVNTFRQLTGSHDEVRPAYPHMDSSETGVA